MNVATAECVGGDAIAAEKAGALRACGARVTVISPMFCGQLQTEGEQGRVTLRRKAYERGDTAGAFVVVAATSDQGLIEALWAETQGCGQLVNIVDVPAEAVRDLEFDCTAPVLATQTTKETIMASPPATLH